MNVRLSIDFKFTAAFVYQRNLEMNNYEGTLAFTTNTVDSREQAIAVDRIRFFIDSVLESSIFINAEHTTEVDAYRVAGANVIALPEDPYDQIISMMLFTKFAAITEDKITVDSLTLSSTAGANVKFFLEFDESRGPFDNAGWWSDSSIITQDIDNTLNNSVVTLDAQRTPWESFYLGWADPAQRSEVIPNVVVGKFNEKD